jgi:hypothetical protein
MRLAISDEVCASGFTITRAFIVILFHAGVAIADDAPDPLFLENEILDVTITAPFATLVRERPTEDYLPGRFRYAEADGSIRDFDLEIRTRGHFRHANCDFPPVRLNFKKSQTRATLFDNQDKLKLVVHCDDSVRYEQTILREYLAYRILNELTDMSFRVRLLRVSYVDIDGRWDQKVRFAFLIEHVSRLADRIDRKDLAVSGTTVDSIQSDLLNLTSIFEFFIGNTDFSPIAGAPGNDCCHNYVLFGNDADPIVAIPYDFDQSGFVNAPYAHPNQRFRLRSVRQRLYRGRCVNNEHVEASLQEFRDNRATIYALIETQEGLHSRTRKSLVGYADGFYKLIDDPKNVERKIIGACI